MDEVPTKYRKKHAIEIGLTVRFFELDFNEDAIFNIPTRAGESAQ
jgi:hypothetical protein